MQVCMSISFPEGNRKFTTESPTSIDIIVYYNIIYFTYLIYLVAIYYIIKVPLIIRTSSSMWYEPSRPSLQE